MTVPTGSEPERLAADRRRRPRWRLLLALVGGLVALVLVTGAGYAEYRVASRSPKVDVRVVGHGQSHTVRLGDGSAVSAALREARVRPRDGRLLSARTRRVLDPRLDPAVITIDGRPASARSSLLQAGPARVVRVVDGTDRTEGTRTVEEVIPAPVAPDNLRHVEERGRPGRLRKVVGERSGEVVSSQVLVPAVAPRRTERKVVALTFDDGPTLQWTPYVLALLADKGVHATFCEVGNLAAAHPELSKQVVAAGHQLCNHTLGHDEGMVAAGDPARIEHQVVGGREAFVSLGLPAPGYYRPPGGFLSPLVVRTARREGERVLMWSVDTKDWQRNSTPESILANLWGEIEPGAVILLHDGGGKDRVTTIAALGMLIDQLKFAGYEFVFPLIDGVAPAG